MAFQNVLYPVTVSRWGSGARFNTQITTGVGGHEYRNKNWQDPLFMFNGGYNVKTISDARAVFDFFMVMGGREQGFMVQDYLNYSVDDWTAVQETIAGSSQNFQLYKPYSYSGATTVTKDIYKCLKTTVELREDSVEKTRVDSSPTAGTEFTVDETTGLITYDPVDSNNALEFKVGMFYYPARFDIDELLFETLQYIVDGSGDEVSGQTQIPDIPLMETRDYS